MNNPLISIIVPVYNVERYLRPCLDSILSQTYINWEAILVDDGSKDNSGKICDEYAASDSRFVVVHKQNEGVSIARNTGIDKSRSWYLTFVDADDKFGKDYIEVLMNSREHPLVVSGYQKFGTQYGKFGPEKKQLVNMERNLSDLWKTPKSYWWFVWGKLFDIHIIRKNNIRFRTGMIYLEDFCFVLDYLCYVDHICLINNYNMYHLIEATKYTKYRMDYHLFKLHAETHNECFCKLENKSGVRFNEMRRMVYRRHWYNFMQFIKKSPLPFKKRVENVIMFRRERKLYFYKDIQYGGIDRLIVAFPLTIYYQKILDFILLYKKN